MPTKNHDSTPAETPVAPTIFTRPNIYWKPLIVGWKKNLGG